MAKRKTNQSSAKGESLSLGFVWRARLQLRAEGDKLRAEGDKLRAEGNKLWAEAVLEVYGNIAMEWEYVEARKNYRCVLETGESFEP